MAVKRVMGPTTAQSILEILRARHARDVFVSECKDGETYYRRDLCRLDAWVLLRTYSHPNTIGYEIKVSRSDFERDQKWVSYIDLAHQMYFVCPGGLIRSDELPLGPGLIWVSQSGVLHVKKRAEVHQPDVVKQHRLLIYVLMSRANIVSNMYQIDMPPPSPEDRVAVHLAEVKRWVEEARAKKDLAVFVRGHIREMYDEISKRELRLYSQQEQVQRFSSQLAKLGITWDAEHSKWTDNCRVDNEIAALKSIVDTYTVQSMRELARRLTEACDTLDRFHQKKDSR